MGMFGEVIGKMCRSRPATSATLDTQLVPTNNYEGITTREEVVGDLRAARVEDNSIKERNGKPAGCR